MPPSVCGIFNDVVGLYDVSGSGRYYEVQEGVQHLLIVSIYSLYDVALFGHVHSTALIIFNTPSDLVGNSGNTFLLLDVFTALLIDKTSISSMVQGKLRVIQNNFVQRHRTEASIRDCLHSPRLSFLPREEQT